MTLILTQINKHGIIFASDSNVTVGNTHTVRGKKIFEIPKLRAALCCAGAYSVGQEMMDKWMQNYIQADKSQSLKEFTENLCSALKNKMRVDEKRAGCIIHISGFVNENGIEHPEMWGISNVESIKSDGTYLFRDNLDFREDFWSRDWKKKETKDMFKSGGYLYYINGFTPGRVAFNILSQRLTSFLLDIWAIKNYKFKPPKNIREHKSLVRFSMNFIALMFNLSEYRPKSIGGKIKIFSIKSRAKKWFTQ